MLTCEKCNKVYAETFDDCPHCRHRRRAISLALGLLFMATAVAYALIIPKNVAGSATEQGAPTSVAGTTSQTEPRDDQYTPRHSSLSTLIPSCPSGAACENDIYQKVWLRLEADNGQVTKVDTKSIQHYSNGAADVAVYTYVPNTNFDPSKLRRLFFDCAGHFRDDTEGPSAVMDAPPYSIAGQVAAIACAGTTKSNGRGF